MKKYNISHTYSVDLWDEGVCDSQGFPIGWIYACLNPIRQKVERSLNLTQTNFQLSPYYIAYFDLLEKSESFAKGIIETARQPLSYSAVQTLLENPISPDGDWFSFARLAEKYGLVPFHAMVGTEIHAHKTDVLSVLKNRLLLFASELRKADEADFESIKSDLIEDIKGILDSQFGAPPESFNWNYKDKSGSDFSLVDVTPTDFYLDFCETDVGEYTVVADEKVRKDEKTDILYLPVSDIKALCRKQLESGEQVIVCADTRQQSNQMLGILDTDFCDNESVFGSDRQMSKTDSFEYKRILPRDFLSLDGVHIEDNSPVRFKAQDSNGALTGADGHYTMNEKWFDEYVFYAVINNRFLSK
jgi:bleomycin hydrolase